MRTIKKQLLRGSLVCYREQETVKESIDTFEAVLPLCTNCFSRALTTVGFFTRVENFQNTLFLFMFYAKI